MQVPHYFWKSFEVDFRVAKNIAKTLGVVVPDFRYSESIASIGDRLCDIGSCENIRKKLYENPEYKWFNNSLYEPIQQKHGLNREAFSIWKEHYKFYDNKKMEDILYIVERVYKDMMWVGANHGKRNLDHGVCSGLITLQALTFFHELFWGFCWSKWPPEPTEAKTADSFSQKQENLLEDNSYNRVSKRLFSHIKYEITRVPKRIMVRREFNSKDYADHGNNGCKLRADFWFKKILWATASSAIHSLIQKDEYSKQCKEHLDLKAMKLKEKKAGKNPDEHKDHLRIGLDDDPLAFLGLLVDGLQEWDRYKVTGRGEAAFSGPEPLQNTDVEIDLIHSDSIHYAMLRESVFSGTELLLQSTEAEVECIHSHIIHLTYPKNGKDWAKALKANLDKCLEKWEEIVQLTGKSQVDL